MVPLIAMCRSFSKWRGSLSDSRQAARVAPLVTTHSDEPVLLWVQPDMTVTAGGSSLAARALFGQSVDSLKVETLVAGDFVAIAELCREVERSPSPQLLRSVPFRKQTPDGATVHRDVALCAFPLGGEGYCLLAIGGPMPQSGGPGPPGPGSFPPPQGERALRQPTASASSQLLKPLQDPTRSLAGSSQLSPAQTGSLAGQGVSSSQPSFSDLLPSPPRSQSRPTPRIGTEEGSQLEPRSQLQPAPSEPPEPSRSGQQSPGQPVPSEPSDDSLRYSSSVAGSSVSESDPFSALEVPPTREWASCEVQTDVSWARHGFQCLRCSRPPLMPQAVTNSTRLMALDSKLKLKRKKPFTDDVWTLLRAQHHLAPQGILRLHIRGKEFTDNVGQTGPVQHLRREVFLGHQKLEFEGENLFHIIGTSGKKWTFIRGDGGCGLGVQLTNRFVSSSSSPSSPRSREEGYDDEEEEEEDDEKWESLDD